MPKIGDLGNSGLGQVPKNWKDNASRATFLKPWPTFKGKGTIGPLEPYGNPAYEGYGYPAAGYGVRRRKVVKLAKPKVPAGQLTAGGWEGKVPQGTRITSMGTLNSRSDYYNREVIASLAGLGGLGQVGLPSGIDLMSNERPTPEQAQKRAVAAWNIIKEADRLTVVMQGYLVGRKVIPFFQLERWAGLADAEKALKTLTTNWWAVDRKRLVGGDDKSNLDVKNPDAVVNKPNRNWKAWLDAVDSYRQNIQNMFGDTFSNGLLAYIFDTAKETGLWVAERGKDLKTGLEVLLKPEVLLPLLAIGGVVYLFGKSGGSLVSVKPQ